MKKTISLTVSNRPQYLKRFLTSLAQCKGIGDYRLVIGLEPSCSESRALVEAIDFVETEIVYNPMLLGVKENPFRLLEHVFALSDFNVYLEEDVLVSSDILLLANWYAKHECRDRNPILCLSNFNTTDYTKDTAVIEYAGPGALTPFSWVTTKQFWGEFMRGWWFSSDKGWDYGITSKMPFLMVRPLCSRCTHIGEIGIHMTSELHAKLYADKSYYMGTPVTEFHFNGP